MCSKRSSRALAGCRIFQPQRAATDATGALIQPLRDERDNKLPRSCKKGHFFTAVADEAHVLFAYLEKHTQAEVAKLFAGFNGYLQADASSVYHLLEHGRTVPQLDDAAPLADSGVTLVGCNPNARCSLTFLVLKPGVGRAPLSRSPLTRTSSPL